MKNTAGMVLGAAALAGCVSNGTYKESQDALAEAQAAAAACKTQMTTCGQQLNACTVARDQAAADRDHTGADLDACRQQTAAVKGNVDELENRANELRDKLQSEISNKNVEIEQLKGKLSLHMLDRILFKSGSADILPEGRAALDKVAAVLASTPELIRVEGHTDAKPVGDKLKGKYPTNWELSAARAAAVVRLFETEHKIDPVRLEVVGLSQYHPAATGDAPEDLQRNRRVEIVLTSPKEAPAK